MKKNCKKKPIKPILDSNKFNFGGLATGTGFGQAVDMNALNLKAGADMSRLAKSAPPAPAGIPGMDSIMPGLGVAQGAMELGTQIAGNLNTDGIGKEVVGTHEMSRGDILNTNVSVDANKSNVFGESAKGMATGLKAGMAFGPMGAGIGAAAGLIGGLGSSLIGNAKKQNLAERAEDQWTNNLQAKDRQFQQQDFRSGMANFAAFGGDLSNPIGGFKTDQIQNLDELSVVAPRLNKPQAQAWTPASTITYNRDGKSMTSYDNVQTTFPEDWKSTEGMSSDDARTKFIMQKYNGTMRNGQYRDANINANGGNLFGFGGQQNPLTEFNSGGTHEQNPQGGIMQGTGANGKPNFVEEGETKHEDYIFSNRLKIDAPSIIGNSLPMNIKGKTFATASKMLNKEAKERPNDPISMNAVKANMAKLTQAQEAIKQAKAAKEQPQEDPQANMLAQGFASGGNLFFDGDFLSMNDQSTRDRFSMVSEQRDQLEALKAMTENSANANRYTADNSKNTYSQTLPFDSSMGRRGDYMSDETPASPSGQKAPGLFDKMQGKDLSRYAPAMTNAIVGIGDIFSKAEEVKLGRMNPEQITSRMDYQPIDTEWMANKMKGQGAGMRDSILNASGGNRAIAMAGLSGINRQSQEALGQQYLQAQDVNYGRKNQAMQFNANVEQQNVASRNAAQQQNLQIGMQEMDMNARNRAAKRNAARNAILQSSQDLGNIGRENWAQKTGAQMTGYRTDSQGNITYQDGSVYDKNGKKIK